MNRKTSLTDLFVLPKLFNGKVCIIEDDSYRLVKPSMYCTIADDFEPNQYQLLETDKYTCIIQSHRYSSEYHAVNKLYKEILAARKAKEAGQLRTRYNEVLEQLFTEPVDPKVLRCYPGDVIHLVDRQGMFTVTEISLKYITVTCKTWAYTGNRERKFPITNFKCLAGGRNNAVYS